MDTLDYTGLSDKEILKIVERDISPGSIILQHCFQDNKGLLEGSYKALPQIINLALENSMEIVTISEI